MYIKINDESSIKSEKIVGIFDLDKTTVYKTNRVYLSKREKNGRIESVKTLPKSFVVCGKGSEEKIYLSALMPATVLKRIKISHSAGISLGGEENT